MPGLPREPKVKNLLERCCGIQRTGKENQFGCPSKLKDQQTQTEGRAYRKSRIVPSLTYIEYRGS
jgi:hypothetical protein